MDRKCRKVIRVARIKDVKKTDVMKRKKPVSRQKLEDLSETRFDVLQFVLGLLLLEIHP